MHDINSPEGQLAKVVWEASRADEGSISAMGADIVASAIIAALERGELKLPTTPGPSSATAREVLVVMMASQDVANSQSGTLWRFVRKFGAMYGVEFGVGVPTLTVDGVPQDPADPAAWRLGPNRIMEVPEPPAHPLQEVLERIAEAIENSGPDNDALSSIAGALDDIERHQR